MSTSMNDVVFELYDEFMKKQEDAVEDIMNRLSYRERLKRLMRNPLSVIGRRIHRLRMKLTSSNNEYKQIYSEEQCAVGFRQETA